jgi:hypothetical protein
MKFRSGTPLTDALAENDRLIEERRHAHGAEGTTFRLLESFGGNQMQHSLNAWLDAEFKRDTPIHCMAKALATLIANVVVIPALRTSSPTVFCEETIHLTHARTTRVLSGDSPVEMVEVLANGHARASTVMGLIAERDRG